MNPQQRDIKQPHTRPPANFTENVMAETQVMQRFVQILQAEQEALTQGDIDKLAEYARIKSEQGVQLSQLNTNRQRILKLYGLGSTADDIGLVIRREDPDGGRRLTQHWENLLDLAKQAHDINRLNGAMIESQLKRNQQALAILQESAKQTSLYGKDGHSQALGLGRILGKV